MIGGTFSHPAEKYPNIFKTNLLKTYPYLLPGIIAAGVAIAGAIFGYLYLEEVCYLLLRLLVLSDPVISQTLPSKRRRTRDEPSIAKQQLARNDRPPSMGELMQIPTIRALSLSGSALAFISTAFDVVFVLFCYTPIKTGGLAFTVSIITRSNTLDH